MKRVLAVLAAVVWGVVCAGAQALTNIPLYDDMDLSGDGKHLLLVRSDGEAYDLVIRDLATGEENTLYEGDAQKGLINWCRWANGERIVCSVRYYVPRPASVISPARACLR